MLAAGAMLGQDYLFCRNTGSNEDIAVGDSQVNMGLTRIGIALDYGIKFETGIAEGIHDFVTHLKTILHLRCAGAARG